MTLVSRASYYGRYAVLWFRTVDHFGASNRFRCNWHGQLRSEADAGFEARNGAEASQHDGTKKFL